MLYLKAQNPLTHLRHPLKEASENAVTVAGIIKHKEGNNVRPLARSAESVGRLIILPSNAEVMVGSLGIRSVKTSQTGTRETGEDIFPLQGSVHGLDDSQFVTLHLDSGRYVRFQVDTGAQLNVIPLDIYKKAIGDASLTKITPSHTQVTAYGGNNLLVVESAPEGAAGWVEMPPGLQDNRPLGNPPPSWSQSLPRNENHSLPRQRPSKPTSNWECHCV